MVSAATPGCCGGANVEIVEISRARRASARGGVGQTAEMLAFDGFVIRLWTLGAPGGSCANSPDSRGWHQASHTHAQCSSNFSTFAD